MLKHHVEYNTFKSCLGWDLDSTKVKKKHCDELVCCPDAIDVHVLASFFVCPTTLFLTTRWHLRNLFGENKSNSASSQFLLCMFWKSSIRSSVVSRCSYFSQAERKKQNSVIINTSDGQTFSKSLQVCAKVECKFHGRVDKPSVFIWLSECSCDGVGPRVCQQLTSHISGIMFSDTDCDLIATLPLAMVCAVLRVSCVIWKWPITDVLFQLWLLPLHINHSWSVYPDPLVPFTIPQTQIPRWNTNQESA